MGGEQAATVLATITKDKRAREGKEVGGVGWGRLCGGAADCGGVGLGVGVWGWWCVLMSSVLINSITS